MPFDILKTISQPWNDAIEAYASGLVAEANAAKDVIIAGHLATINSLTAQIAMLNATVATLNATIADQQTQIAARDAAIVTRDAQIATLTATIAARDAEIVVLKARIAELEAGGPTPPPPVVPTLLDQAFPQLITRAWVQEDLAPGAVASWVPRGLIAGNATQTDTTRQPVKLADNGGVYFAKAATKFLSFTGNNESPYAHRWWVTIARSDVSNTGELKVCAINGISGAQTNRQPYISFNGTAPKSFRFGAFDTAVRNFSAPAETDFTKWQVLVGYRRGGQMRGWINGVETPAQDFRGFAPISPGPTCFFGNEAGVTLAELAIDCVFFGNGELTDYQVNWIVGWAHHRAGRQDLLPAFHPYKTAAPTLADLTPSETTDLYKHDATAWQSFVDQTNAIRYTHRGEPTYSEAGYKRVFFTDFDQADQYPTSDLRGTPSAAWFSPLHLDVINVTASNRQPSGLHWPDGVIQDLAAEAGGPGRPGSLAFRIHNVGGQWRSGAICSINNNGTAGRTWAKGIFKARIKFPVIPKPRPGLFPAFWGYGLEHLIYRTRNRIELDMFEADSKNTSWVEGNHHVHQGRFLYPADPTIAPISQHKELYSGALGPALGWPTAFDYQDGNYHDWVCKVEDDFTYFWLDGFEAGRVVTTEAMKKPRYLILNLALSGPHGDRSILATETFDMTIDYVEIMQKESDLAIVPAGFSALPTLSAAGGVLTATPNTSGSQIEYLWYRDGVPIINQGPAYTTVPADVGHMIRVHVKNRAIVNQPEAWSAEFAA